MTALPLHTAATMHLATDLVAAAEGQEVPAWPDERTPVYLYIRNTWAQARSVSVAAADADPRGGRYALAVSAAKLRHQARVPYDVTIGPVGAGPMEWPHATWGLGGLYVLAYTLTSGTPEGGHGDDSR